MEWMCCKIAWLQGLMACSGVANWLEKHQLPCFYRSVFGIDCPGCGMQRAMIALLRGDFIGSVRLYPALIPVIVMLLLLAVHVVVPLKHGARMLLILFVVNAIIIVSSYIYKLTVSSFIIIK